MSFNVTLRIFILLVTIFSVLGCVATLKPESISSSSLSSQKSTKSDAQIVLETALVKYHDGDYQGTIKMLEKSLAIWSAPVEIQTQALKYLAFANCVNNRRSMCRQRFDQALQLNPQFELSSAEVGHPIWGLVFKQAKRAAANKSGMIR